MQAALRSCGFTAALASEATLHARTLDAALAWLCLHVPEDDLPAQYRPTAASELTFVQVQMGGDCAPVMPVRHADRQSVVPATGQDPMRRSARASATAALHRWGYARRQAEAALLAANDSREAAAAALWRDLVGLAIADPDPALVEATSDDGTGAAVGRGKWEGA